MKARKPMAQGDILAVPVENIPDDATEAKPTSGRHVLAIGESTHHSHSVLSSRAALFVADRPASGSNLTIGWLKVGSAGADIEHLHGLSTKAEHDPISLSPGIWQIRRQREATDDDEPRLVAD